VLASQVRDLRKRSDVSRILGPDDRFGEDYVDTYTTEQQLVVRVLFSWWAGGPGCMVGRAAPACAARVLCAAPHTPTPSA
jgi:hypothetical protein